MPTQIITVTGSVEGPATISLVVNPSTPTVDGLTISSSHPRLWWTPSRISQAKTWLVAHPFAPNASDPYGNAFMYVMTGNATYAQNAITSLMNFTISSSELAAVQSDTYRWNDWVPEVFDWCHDQLTASQISTFVSRYNGYTDTIAAKSWGDSGMPASNYFWGTLRNELAWGIATYGPDNAKAKTYLDDALTTRWAALGVYAGSTPLPGSDGNGGVPVEGTQYGRYTLQYPVVPFISCRLLGRDVYQENNYFLDSLFFLIYNTTPTTLGGTYYLGSWSDIQIPPVVINTGVNGSNQYYGDYIRAIIDEYQGTNVAHYAQTWLNNITATDPSVPYGSDSAGGGSYKADVDIWVQSVFTPDPSPLPFSNLPLDYYAPGSQYLWWRDTWNPNAMMVFLQMGQPDGVGHLHSDAGSFQIWNNGQWLAPENPGYVQSWADGTFSNSTASHNCVVVNGVGSNGYEHGQFNGEQYVTRLSSGPDFAYVSCDLTTLYNNAATVTKVSKYVRDILFIRSMKTIITLDRIQTSASQTSKFLLHSQTLPVISGNKATVTVGQEKLILTALLAGSSFATVNEGANGQLGQMYRLEESYTGTQTYILNTIQALDATGEIVVPSIIIGPSSWTINISTQTMGYATIVLNFGPTSSGGTADHSTTGLPTTRTPLRADIQSISVSSNGPVWGA